jgi:hypothetical protein
VHSPETIDDAVADVAPHAARTHVMRGAVIFLDGGAFDPFGSCRGRELLQDVRSELVGLVVEGIRAVLHVRERVPEAVALCR